MFKSNTNTKLVYYDIRINRDLDLVFSIDLIILYSVIVNIILLNISIVVSRYSLISYSLLVFIIIDIFLAT